MIEVVAPVFDEKVNESVVVVVLGEDFTEVGTIVNQMIVEFDVESVRAAVFTGVVIFIGTAANGGVGLLPFISAAVFVAPFNTYFSPWGRYVGFAIAGDVKRCVCQ